MSTKIYNGYRLAPGTNIFDLVPDMVQALGPVRDRLDARVLAVKATAMIDDADLAGSPRPRSPLTSAYRDITDEQAKARPGTWEHAPHRFEVAVGSDPVTGALLALTFSEELELREAFESLDVVHEYGYWNNADLPDEVSAAEWDERRDAWARVLPGVGVPADTMWSWSLCPDPAGSLFGLAQPQDQAVHPLVLDQIPTKGWRLSRLVARTRLDALAGSLTGFADVMGHAFEAWRVDGDLHARCTDLLGDLDAADLSGRGDLDHARTDALRDVLDEDAAGWASQRRRAPQKDGD
ncbi:hypothetical protein [Oerskovia enterophila]|uniref:Uncharacterized protein n=1 Tax=Oerskovia enterophila TaxID=43678 RepID=A0ABX2Y8H9_9CELL|nr:hypothetical protein [Oerskovia enterophila]OCI32907.1 hypothetical protein OERS_04990 [Oerskovia enterophila]